MAYHQQGNPGLSATFVPGGFDDYYMPNEAPELISPAPQRSVFSTRIGGPLMVPEVDIDIRADHCFLSRHMPEVPDQMQENLAQLESKSGGSRISVSHFQQPPPVQPFQQSNPQAYHPPSAPISASSEYSQSAPTTELPHFSPFPKLMNPLPNVPPSDDEKEAILENARVPVLSSNDPEMQLAWAQDALAYVAASNTYEERLAENRPARPSTPAVEHQLKVDALSIVGFLADQGHPKAEFMKGMWLEFGNFGWRQDKREAFRSYSRAAEKGFARAEYRMGMQFEQNNDPIKALVHYQRGSDAGDAASNYRLGMMTLMGQMGQPQDFAKGVRMLRIAAEQADENAPQGAYVLGMLQARELPQVTVPESILPYNEAEARVNIEKAAYLGFAKAQLKMGMAYELCSLGCDFDPALSLHYNALAARQGEPEAEMAISKWFLCGSEGIFPKNEELAYEYALRAAQSGLPTAQFALGYFNEIGMYVPVNLDKATEWYDKAARNGNQDAIGRIESLKHSAVLSKTDHESVAINKIKSQYGSMRGKRPDRLKAQAPSLPSVSDEQDEHPPANGRMVIPPRGSSTTPYPIDNGPPLVPPPNNRPASVAPYPMDNGPPKIAGGRPPLAGGFAPELRSASAGPAQFQQRQSSGGAFNINPAIYGQRPEQDPYGRNPQPHANLPLRPATTVADMSPGGRQGLPSQQRPPNAQPNYGRQPSSTHTPPSGPQGPPADIGYAAPNGLARHSPNTLHGQPSLQDIGYVAPLQARRPSPVDGMPPQTATRPPRGDSARPPASNYPQQPQGRTQSQPQPQTGGRPPRLDSTHSAATIPQAPPKQASGRPQPGAGRPSQPGAGRPNQPGAQPAPQATAQRPAAAAGQPPKKGPKTFDDMGVPAGKDQGDCVSNVAIIGIKEFTNISTGCHVI
jgi:TPR repeat protein